MANQLFKPDDHRLQVERIVIGRPQHRPELGFQLTLEVGDFRRRQIDGIITGNGQLGYDKVAQRLIPVIEAGRLHGMADVKKIDTPR